MYRNIFPREVNQMYGLESTSSTSALLKQRGFASGGGIFFDEWPVYSSMEGSPIFSGISRKRLSRNPATAKEKKAGTRKAYFQPSSTRYPPATKMTAAPTWCELPKTAQLLP